MASVATGPSKPSFQCLYLDGSVRKSTRMVSPSAMSCLPRATGLSQNDPERLGPLRAEILPAVRRAAVEQRAVTGLEQVAVAGRSEEHTSELQSPCNLVCRLLLEKKKARYSCCTRTAS